MPRIFVGCIASKLLNNPTYAGRSPQTAKELYEVTIAQAKYWTTCSNGKPVLSEHANSPIGKVIRTYITADGKFEGEFEIDDSTPSGVLVCSLLDNGLFHDLSFSHHSITNDPDHLSICWKGARDNTHIKLPGMNTKSESYKENEKASDIYKTQLVNASSSTSSFLVKDFILPIDMNNQFQQPLMNAQQQMQSQSMNSNNNLPLSTRAYAPPQQSPQPYMTNDGNTMTLLHGANNNQAMQLTNFPTPMNMPPQPSVPQQLAAQGVMTPEQHQYNNMLIQQKQQSQQQQMPPLPQNSQQQQQPTSDLNQQQQQQQPGAPEHQSMPLDPMQNAKNGLSKLLTQGTPRKIEAMAVVDLVTSQDKTIAALTLENEKLRSNEGESNSQFKTIMVEFMKKVLGPERIGNNFESDLGKTMDNGDMDGFRRLMVPTLIAASSAVQPCYAYHNGSNQAYTNQQQSNYMDEDTTAKLELIQKLNLFPQFNKQNTSHNNHYEQHQQQHAQNVHMNHNQHNPLQNNFVQASSSMSSMMPQSHDQKNSSKRNNAFMNSGNTPSALMNTNAGWAVSTSGLPDATRLMFEAHRNEPMHDKVKPEHYTTREQMDNANKRAKQAGGGKLESDDYAFLQSAPRLQ